MRDFRDLYEDRYGRLTVALLAGVLPLFSDRHAAFLDNEVPGIRIPEGVRGRIARSGEGAPEEGIRLAQELTEALRGVAQGIYLMPAFHRYDLAAEVVDHARSNAVDRAWKA